MYTLDQRNIIGGLFRATFKSSQIPCTRLQKAIQQQCGITISGSTIHRVCHGGGTRTEEIQQGFNAYAQNEAISALAKVLGIDLAPYRATYQQSPEFYFPDSPAFRPYQRSWIFDCFDRKVLEGLAGTCRKALAGTGKTDGADHARLEVALEALSLIKRKTFTAVTQSELPLVESVAAPIVGANIAEASATLEAVRDPHPTGNLSLDAERAALRQLEALNLPTAEVKEAILRKVRQLLEA